MDTLAKTETFAPMLDELAAAFDEAGLLKDEWPLAIDSTHFESHQVSRHFAARKKRGKERKGEKAGETKGKAAPSKTRSRTVENLPKLAIAVACAAHAGAVGLVRHGHGVGPPALRDAGLPRLATRAGEDGRRRCGIRFGTEPRTGTAGPQLRVVHPAIDRPTERTPAERSVRSGDAIVAEHPVARRRGESVTQKQHIDELWKLALQRTPAPLPNWRLTFDHAVAATPLDRYERVIDQPLVATVAEVA